ncbi:MAG TPA: RDD family protein [Cytophagaceae bacterium]
MKRDIINLTSSAKASFWKRLIAFSIDYTLLIILLILSSELVGQMEIIESFVSTFGLFSIMALLEHYKQVTVGKAIMKLKVIDRDGKPPTLLHSFYRNYGRIASAYDFLQGFLRILAPHHHQTVHDEFAGCWVVDASIQRNERQLDIT